MKEKITVFSVVYNGYGRFIPQWNEYMNKQTIPVKKLIKNQNKEIKEETNKDKSIKKTTKNKNKLG